jgi:hypothetical protein
MFFYHLKIGDKFILYPGSENDLFYNKRPSHSKANVYKKIKPETDPRFSRIVFTKKNLKTGFKTTTSPKARVIKLLEK